MSSRSPPPDYAAALEGVRPRSPVFQYNPTKITGFYPPDQNAWNNQSVHQFVGRLRRKIEEETLPATIAGNDLFITYPGALKVGGRGEYFLCSRRRRRCQQSCCVGRFCTARNLRAPWSENDARTSSPIFGRPTQVGSSRSKISRLEL